ncbi:putative fatty acyl-CoA reductase CG5065 [Hermetia illucens]|nr:putative fatty acyl-CoA reductase CG5065 [Hermetia illucens]XP_037902546.1 putative fatty acyl-CoA reductase CG5065 [Hermetia illucens]XP_037902547.1 putative fatty acyl-CoA reductase CG5065 [Hermetia illucens]
MEEDRIAKSYAGRSLFITGGTGFLGKVLVEKLLRCCPEIKKIYLLVRNKKGKDPQIRIKEMFDNVLFDTVKKQRGAESILNVCEALCGDVTIPDLGMSEDDKQIIRDNVSVIYHCAATIRFDEELKKAVFLNVRGTKLILQLAKECKRLELFTYVSTAYCHLHIKHLVEQPYAPPADPHKVIAAMEWMSDDVVASIQKKVLGDIPNTYAYTKSLAEALVVETFDSLPSVILRPSIVIPIWKTPLPGWTDNINGPTGLLIGAGKGVIRTMYCNSSGYGDYLPVDIAVNAMLCVTWQFLTTKNFDIRVRHLTSSNEIKVSWQEVIELGRWVIENRLPLNGVVWYPGGSMKSNRFVHYVCTILYHWIPAMLIDTLLWCLRYPPVLCRVHRRIQKGFEVFEYYANNQWDFDNSSVLELRRMMNDTERHKYIIEKIDVDLVEYFEACTLCARRYILNEPDDTIPQARKHMKVMYCVDRVVKTVFLGILLYYLGCFLYRMFFNN